MVFDYQDDETKLIEVTKEIENTRKPGTPPPDAPKTGDHTKIWIPVIIMAAAIHIPALLLTCNGEKDGCR